jgi:hypothetical protein
MLFCSGLRESPAEAKERRSEKKMNIKKHTMPMIPVSVRMAR